MTLCLYKPARAQQNSQCTAEATTPYGYCNKHKTTVAAKKAKEEYDRKLVETQKDKSQEETEEQEEAPVPEEKPQTTTVPTKPKSPAKEQTKTVKIVRNKWDNFEHTETGIVFDLNTKKAYGVQQANGKVRRLLDADIKVCQKNLWGFYIFKDNAQEAKLPAKKTIKQAKTTKKKVESEDDESSEEDSEEDSESSDDSEEESEEEEEEKPLKKKAPVKGKGKQEESEDESEESEEDESEDDESEDESEDDE